MLMIGEELTIAPPRDSETPTTGDMTTGVACMSENETREISRGANSKKERHTRIRNSEASSGNASRTPSLLGDKTKLRSVRECDRL